MWRLVPNKCLDLGRIDSMLATQILPIIEREQNDAQACGGIKASMRGAILIKRGGRAFELTIAPVYNPLLNSEKEDLIVVGRVASVVHELSMRMISPTASTLIISCF